jgi:branched-chain amino acid transport system ATP-binding protein
VREPLLAITGLAKSFGGVRATDGVDLTVEPDEVHALIGPNGAGKTTLIAQLSGLVEPDAGAIRFAGRDITGLAAHARAHAGLARSFQITSLLSGMTALENVALAVQARDGHSYRFWRPAAGDGRLSQPALAALAQVGIAGRADVAVGALSHGERRQLEIAMALASRPRLLLLDEPMAGMGPEESARMIDILKGLKGTTAMLLVEHDMDAVFALADRISVLVYGKAIASGAPADIRANAAVKRAYLGEE